MNKYRMFTKIVRNMSLSKKRDGGALNDNEAETLRYISKRPLCISNEIADYLSVDKALIARIVHKLESLGYITCEDGADKRKKYLKITEKGLALKLGTERFETEYYKKILEDMPEEEQDMLFTLLEKVYLKSKELRKAGK